MPLLSITKTYADTQILSESDLDNILNSVQSWANGTIDNVNIAANGILTANIADNAVTAAKIDETDDYEMESLLLGDVTGPTLSKAANDTLLVEDLLQLANNTDGPILSRSAADTLLVANALELEDSSGPVLSKASADRLLIANSAQLENSTDGPILSRDGANGLKVDDYIQVDSHITIASGGPELAQGSGTATTLRNSGPIQMRTNFAKLDGVDGAKIKLTDNNDGLKGNLLLSEPADTRGHKVVSGVANTSGTIASGVGFTNANLGVGHCRITFTNAFTATPTITTAVDSAGVRHISISNVSSSSFEVRTWSGAAPGSPSDEQFNFIVKGAYAA